ncbi:hypothetical protein KUTeg_004672 [Tegillarca granosa]|uniref:TFIID subunit TAF5 NTD2 domain-containing protein n=1 Tax=Tegillarca granosa TaxID=220873 RepID=A0ABQ9FKF2_TEGGR|nr:hypothetical protein KUTeg_004672 [Tegillarca granosa]
MINFGMAHNLMLKNFIHDSSEPYKEELQSILFPSFVHIYLQLLCNGHKTPVKEDIMTSLDLREGTTESLTPVNDTRPKQSEVIQNLQQSIKKVREGAPCLSSICFYTFINAYQGLCTVDISPDKTVLSAGFEDSTVKLWSITPGLIHSKQVQYDPSTLFLAADFWDLQEDPDTESKTQYREVAIMRGHNGAVYKTCFTSDSKYLLSSSEDCSVRLWDLETHTNKVCYIGHNYPVWDLDTSSVGSYFVSASQDRTAKLWITDRTYPLRTFCGHTFDVDCVKFHPNCNYIATGSSDKTVRLWSLQDGKSVRLMQGHRGTILAIAFSPNGQYLASAGGLDCCIRIWDVRKGTSYNVTQQDSHTSPELLGAFPTKSATVTYLQFSQYNLLLAAGSI